MKWFDELLCKYFGHEWYMTAQANLPSSRGKSVYAGYGGGLSLSVECERTCEKCGKIETYYIPWD